MPHLTNRDSHQLSVRGPDVVAQRRIRNPVREPQRIGSGQILLVTASSTPAA
jgi:hypothetical protein